MLGYELTAQTAETTESLHRHLAAEDLTGVRISTQSRTPEPGEQGGQEIIVALLTGGTGAALAHAVNTWVANQRQHVKLRLRGPEGEQLELEASGPESLDALRRFFDGNSTDADGT